MKRARKCGAGRGGGSGSNRLRRMAIPPPSDTMTRREHIEIVIMDWIESERVRTMATVQKKNLKNNRQRARVVERERELTLKPSMPSSSETASSDSASSAIIIHSGCCCCIVAPRNAMLKTIERSKLCDWLVRLCRRITRVPFQRFLGREKEVAGGGG